MEKTLYLHIGHYKTGTTALQVFLDRSGGFLHDHGLEYPHLCMHHSKHSVFAFALLRAAGVRKQIYGYDDPTTPEDLWSEMFGHIMASEARGTILSSEEFMRIGQFPAAQDILRGILANRPEGLRVRAIVYLREPDAHVESWYNQLVKMHFPVGDLNAALEGDIEEIHYNYRCAIEPWQNLLGPENVDIRPYVRNKNEPDALHRDFMAAVGVTLPDGMIQAKTDPNPRIDDRVLELVRLMQNAGYPGGTINALRTQAAAYFEAQDAVAPQDGAGFQAVRRKTREGLEWLAQQPHAGLPIHQFTDHLPQPVPPRVVQSNMLLGFVLSEVIQLRQRVNAAALPEMTRRLEAIEARLAQLEPNS